MWGAYHTEADVRGIELNGEVAFAPVSRVRRAPRRLHPLVHFRAVVRASVVRRPVHEARAGRLAHELTRTATDNHITPYSTVNECSVQ